MPVIWFGVVADLDDKLLGWIHFTLLGPYIGSFCFFLAFITCIVVVAKSGMKYAKKTKEHAVPHMDEVSSNRNSIKKDPESAEVASISSDVTKY